jgi:hypothetical protein
MNGAVHRLHGGVRKKRHLIGGLDFGDRARHCADHIADRLRHRTRIERGLSQLFSDVVPVELGVLALVPFDSQHRQTFLRGAHVVGHDRDCVIEAHNLAHASDGAGRRIVHALHAASEHRRLRQRRNLDAGRPRIDPVRRCAVDLCRGIQTLGWSADQFEICRPLEHHVVWNWHAGGVRSKLAVFQPSRRRAVNHFTALRATQRGIDVRRGILEVLSSIGEHSIAAPPPRQACFVQLRRLGAWAATPRGPRWSCRLPAPRQLKD